MNEITLDVQGLEEKTFQSGENVLVEGKQDKLVYIMKEGSVAVNVDGNELCKANTPGTIFGEISVLLNSANTATVTAETETSFYVIDDFMGYFENNPKACIEVAQTLAARVMNMNNHFLEIKHEIMEQEKAGKKSGKLMELVKKMDSFWGQDIL
jgi:CRP-like cAMP-binding protein